MCAQIPLGLCSMGGSPLGWWLGAAAQHGFCNQVWQKSAEVPLWSSPASLLSSLLWALRPQLSQASMFKELAAGTRPSLPHPLPGNLPWACRYYLCHSSWQATAVRALQESVWVRRPWKCGKVPCKYQMWALGNFRSGLICRSMLSLSKVAWYSVVRQACCISELHLE